MIFGMMKKQMHINGVVLMKEMAKRSGRGPDNRERGFTLIEVMVVIVILGILATLIVPRIMGRPEEARQMKAAMDIQSIGQALDMYRLDNLTYPSTEQGLQALVEKPEIDPLPRAWRKDGYLQKLPKDPWSGSYIYLSPGLHGSYDLISYGPDREPGGENDVESWDIEIQ